MRENESQTAGQELTAALRRYFSVGPRTRRYRKGADLHRDMIEAICLASQYPGYFVQRTQDALHAGFGAAFSYDKHVRGYRISGSLHRQISEMSPWHFTALLGRMVDAGVQTTGDGERFFAAMSREMAA
jgi:hypothetical protein